MKLGFFDTLLIVSLLLALGVVGSLDTMRIGLVPGAASLAICLGVALISVKEISR